MTATTNDFFDAIGQKINPGDYVISIRDGTGAKPRMALKFTPSKVSVGASWGNSTSYMDGCSLVVITSNLEKLVAEGHQESIDCMDKLKTTFASQVVHTAATPKPLPPRWLVVGYTVGNAYSGDVVQFVSVHLVEGTGNAAFREGDEEAQALATAGNLNIVYYMNRTASQGNGYYSQYRAGLHWDYGNAGYKECLLSHKTMAEIGLDNVPLNTMIPVTVFNTMVPPTHRITKV